MLQNRISVFSVFRWFSRQHSRTDCKLHLCITWSGEKIAAFVIVSCRVPMELLNWLTTKTTMCNTQWKFSRRKSSRGKEAFSVSQKLFKGKRLTGRSKQKSLHQPSRSNFWMYCISFSQLLAKGQLESSFPPSNGCSTEKRGDDEHAISLTW